MGRPLKTDTFKPQVGDCFYSEELETIGRISKVYISKFTGSEVLDVEYPGTSYEIEIYRTDKVYHHKGDNDVIEECFRVVKGYTGE